MNVFEFANIKLYDSVFHFILCNYYEYKYYLIKNNFRIVCNQLSIIFMKK